MTDPSPRPADPSTDPLRVGVLLFHGFEPLDAIGPAQVFWSLESVRARLAPMRPIEVHLVAHTDDPIRAGHGLVVHPTVTYASCPPLDVLIVPGGTGDEDRGETATEGRRFYARHEPTLSFVQAHAAQVRSGAGADAPLTTSVCTGAFILASAGLLAGRRGNTHWYSRDELVKLMADRGEDFELDTSRVVDDGEIVTAGGVSSGIDLALHLVDRLVGPDAHTAAAMVIEEQTPQAS
jgi:transcriptional regulator GlxA family with amidase domain